MAICDLCYTRLSCFVLESDASSVVDRYTLSTHKILALVCEHLLPVSISCTLGMTIATESSTNREFPRSRVAGRLKHINIHGAKAKIMACKAQPVLAVPWSGFSGLNKLLAKLNAIFTR